jgi:tetratricopeptide (TPR) repeat protein
LLLTRAACQFTLQSPYSTHPSAHLSCTAQEKGNDAFKEHRYPEAVAHYTEALKRGPPAVNPDAHKLYSNLAATYTKLGAYPEGIKVTAGLTDGQGGLRRLR